MELLETRLAYEGYGVNVEIRHYRRIDGTVVERQVIDHPGSVAILAHDDKFVHLVAQPREAVGEDALLEIPAARSTVPGRPSSSVPAASSPRRRSWPPPSGPS